MDYDLSKYEKEVLSSIPNPFGSFEKAKYEMVACNHQRQLKWSFVTTCRNTEDCIEIIKARFREIYSFEISVYPRICTIRKVQNGIRETIFNERL